MKNIYGGIIFHNFTKQLVCPYCGTVQDCHEPDPFDADICVTECKECDREFEYSVRVAREYCSRKVETEEEECRTKD